MNPMSPVRRIDQNEIQLNNHDQTLSNNENDKNTASFLIDIESLKENYEIDPIILHLRKRMRQCNKRHAAYWEYYNKMRFMNNILSIPLLIITSATGVTAIAEIGYNTKIVLPIISTIFGVSSAVLTALQRYCAYPERSEHSKYMAKNYARIQRRIEDNIIYIKSCSSTVDAKTFKKNINSIIEEFEKLANETDDLPNSLIEKFNEDDDKNYKDPETIPAPLYKRLNRRESNIQKQTQYSRELAETFKKDLYQRSSSPVPTRPSTPLLSESPSSIISDSNNSNMLLVVYK